MNAGMDIWSSEGVGPIVKYEDDIDVFCFPTSGGVQPDGPFSSLILMLMTMQKPSAISVHSASLGTQRKVKTLMTLSLTLVSSGQLPTKKLASLEPST